MQVMHDGTTLSIHIKSDNFMVLGALFNILDFLSTNVDMATWVINTVMDEYGSFPIYSINNYVEIFKKGYNKGWLVFDFSIILVDTTFINWQYFGLLFVVQKYTSMQFYYRYTLFLWLPMFLNFIPPFIFHIYIAWK